MDSQLTTDQKIAWIGSRGKGNATWAELRAAGISATQIHDRVRKGLLIPVHRGVYRVGHTAWNTESMYLAAVKACGERAVLAGRAGVFHWGLIRGRPPAPEVAAPTRRRRPGIKTKRRRIDPGDVTTHRGIPILTVAAALVDAAPDLEEDDLARACHEASVRHRILHSHVNAVLARRPRAPGAPKLRRIMTGETPVTLSTVERVFYESLRRAGYPLPEMNRPAGGKRIDARWPQERVTLEILSFTFHNSRHAWERDHERRRQARARGDAFLQLTAGDVMGDRRAMLAELRAGGLRPRPSAG